MTIWRKIKKKFLQWIIKHRLSSLLIGVVLGMLLLKVFAKYIEAWLVCFLGLDQDSRVIDSLQIILLGLPVFILLWYFRTYDTREQLDKSAEQINQNNYFEGLKNLVSNEQLKIEIAVQQLIQLSQTIANFNGGIKLAFIKRLKIPPNEEENKELTKEENVRYFSYAQYIVDWLSENYPSTKLDLTGCNFDNQEFKIKINFAVFRNKKNELGQLSFVKADLSEADLSGANLNGARLDEANLSGAILGKARLAGAFFETNRYPQGIDFKELGYKLVASKRNNKNCSKLVKKPY